MLLFIFTLLYIITDCSDTLYYVKPSGKNQAVSKKVKVSFTREEVGTQ